MKRRSGRTSRMTPARSIRVSTVSASIRVGSGSVIRRPTPKICAASAASPPHPDPAIVGVWTYRQNAGHLPPPSHPPHSPPATALQFLLQHILIVAAPGVGVVEAAPKAPLRVLVNARYR